MRPGVGLGSALLHIEVTEMGHFPSRPSISNVLKLTCGFHWTAPSFSLDLDWLEATATPWNEFTPRDAAPGAEFCEKAAPQLTLLQSCALPDVEHLPGASQDQHSHVPPLTHH